MIKYRIAERDYIQPVALCKKSCETWALLATGTQQSWTEKGWKKTHKTIERQNFLFSILGRLVTIRALKNFLSPVSQKTKSIPFVLTGYSSPILSSQFVWAFASLILKILLNLSNTLHNGSYFSKALKSVTSSFKVNFVKFPMHATPIQTIPRVQRKFRSKFPSATLTQVTRNE